MSEETNTKTMNETMLAILEDRVASISNVIVAISKEGFVPNRYKLNIIDWCSIMHHAYENIDIFTDEQKKNLDLLYNKIIQM